MLRRLKAEPQPDPPLWLLRCGDQGVLGVLALVGLAGLGVFLFWPRSPAARFVELEQLPSRSIRLEIDINQAEWPELSLLPGIGETLARRIVEHRKAYGPFQRPEDLRRVRGIGAKTLERIAPHLAPLPEFERTAE
jgi:competence protein ComEA